MACAHEHGCGHGHGHDDADHVKPGEGEQNLLYLAIDRERISALNEQRAGMAPSIIKPYDERLDETRFLESDVDDELMIHVPFAGSVKLRALLLKTGPEGATPRAVHLYKNTDQLNFDDAAQESPAPTQKLASIPVSRDAIEIPLLAARFPDVQSLTIYIPGSLDGERGTSADPHTRIYFLGFRGEERALQREGPQAILYEAAPRATDHTKVHGTEAGANPFSS